MRAALEVTIDAVPAQVMEVLTDFAAYPEFLPALSQARVLSREDAAWEVAFVARHVRDIPYTLRLQAGPAAAPGALALSWSLVEGALLKNQGRWTLEPLDEGRRTRARYEVEVQPGVHVPRTLLNTLVGRELPEVLAAFKRRAEQREALAAAERLGAAAPAEA